MMKRRLFGLWAAALTALALAGPLPASAADLAPDVMIRQLTDDLLGLIRSDPALHAGDVNRVMAVVDAKVMPNVDFRRMVAGAIGPAWRQATPQQQQRLQEEFKKLLVRTYASALSQINNESVTVKPLRAAPTDNDVVVRTEIRGRGEPIQLDYRMERTPGEGQGWKIYNINVLGVWMVETYRNQFGPEASARGIQGLIDLLAERNRSLASRS